MAEFIAVWLPLIIIFLVFGGLMVIVSKKQMRSYAKHVAEVKAINDEIVAVNREVIAELREIKQILKDKN
ncbi:hypothetical protein NYQ83_15365 [Afifella sp. JA880]|uniref:hypothetical protein n=1 Tax=Afifella sp. JA880 TaxID=2975280 RepID=UPI0021BB7E90|nr:hypothetical protein [Afifella sp. JA880]MCT8268658.1 hypothetical protein [Afifella sp. JA880]